MAKKDWREVFVAQGWAEALVVKGLLESHGIQPRLGYEALGSILGLTMDGLGEIRISVPKELYQEAKMLLENGESGGKE